MFSFLFKNSIYCVLIELWYFGLILGHGHQVPIFTVCSQNKFQCSDNGRCLDEEMLCDGVRDCSNGEDERKGRSWDCRSLTLARGYCDQASKFRCQNGECILMESVCDGHVHCFGGDDESSETCQPGGPIISQFKDHPQKTTWLPKSFLSNLSSHSHISSLPDCSSPDSKTESCKSKSFEGQLTHYCSYPPCCNSILDPPYTENERRYCRGDSECDYYSGCKWEGEFAFCGKKSHSDIVKSNIVSLFLKEGDIEKYRNKIIRVTQGSKSIDAMVCDTCGDEDCNGCCTKNAGASGYLIHMEVNTYARFGGSDGSVNWTCVNC